MDSIVCQGCGALAVMDESGVYRCPASADGQDHVVARVLGYGLQFPRGGSQNPFVRYRELTASYVLARSRGLSDQAYVELVEELDGKVAAVDGRRFTITPFKRNDALSAELGLTGTGGAWVKDETSNVAGSHKARHLMGLAILGEVQARTGLVSRTGPRLAIASCGNAALAAAVVARAWGRPLDVFIPVDANPTVVAALKEHGAHIQVCQRVAGIPGDPCYHAFHKAVSDDGAVPFCCQGPDNGLTIEGGETLGFELVEALLDQRVELDRLFVQVGGGALASACFQGFEDAQRVGAELELPRLHCVQTQGAYPLRRAWERVASALGVGAQADTTRAEHLRGRATAAALRSLASHRADFMWPWESEPHSIAHGILDDETYDWLALVRGTLESGGWPLVVSEDRLAEAVELGRRATGIDVDATGAAGLAGLLELRAQGSLQPQERVAVLFTGARR